MARNCLLINTKPVSFELVNYWICQKIYCFFLVKKFDEVLGMLTFANEIIAHMNQMGGIVEKEKSRRKEDVETKAESDKLEVCPFEATGFN